MADQPQDTDESDDTTNTEPNDVHHTPRWVKISGIVAIAVVVVFVILQLTGLAPEHGPGRHGADKAEKESSQAEDGAAHQPPAGIPDHSRN